MTPPAVSAIVPTYHRPQLVTRAVRSALEQTVIDLEVIVVVDGRDDDTVNALRTVQDARLRIHVPERHLGNAAARNRGVALASAPLVAFLDDDDAWMPQKLARQLAVLPDHDDRQRVVACRFVAEGEAARMTWPRRYPRDGEDLGEYFFCRSTPFTGEGMVITSTILTTKSLAADVPFTEGLHRHVDTDWLLRVARVPGFLLQFVDDDEPLVTWSVEHSRSRITTRRDWRESLDWCRSNRDLLTDRAYAAFVLHVVGSNAAAQHAWGAMAMLLREAFREGRPAPIDVASHIANFLLPAAVQRRVAGWVGGIVSPASGARP